MQYCAKKTGAFLLSAAMLLTSCGNGDTKTSAEKTTTTAATTAPPALKPVDLSSYGIPLTIQAPEGAVAAKEEGGDGVTVVKDRFNIIIREDKYGDEAATVQQAKDAAQAEDNQTLNDTEMGMKMEILKNDPAGYIYMTTNKAGGKIVRFTCFVQKENKKYIIKENFMELNDMDKALETGYSISREEIEVMYNAVKQ